MRGRRLRSPPSWSSSWHSLTSPATIMIALSTKPKPTIGAAVATNRVPSWALVSVAAAAVPLVDSAATAADVAATAAAALASLEEEAEEEEEEAFSATSTRCIRLSRSAGGSARSRSKREPCCPLQSRRAGGGVAARAAARSTTRRPVKNIMNGSTNQNVKTSMMMMIPSLVVYGALVRAGVPCCCWGTESG